MKNLTFTFLLVLILATSSCDWFDGGSRNPFDPAGDDPCHWLASQPDPKEC